MSDVKGSRSGARRACSDRAGDWLAVLAQAVSWNRRAAVIRLPEAMVRRSVLILGVLYLTGAVIGHAKERRRPLVVGALASVTGAAR